MNCSDRSPFLVLFWPYKGHKRSKTFGRAHGIFIKAFIQTARNDERPSRNAATMFTLQKRKNFCICHFKCALLLAIMKRYLLKDAGISGTKGGLWIFEENFYIFTGQNILFLDLKNPWKICWLHLVPGIAFEKLM